MLNRRLRIERAGRPLLPEHGWHWENPAGFAPELNLWFVAQGHGTLTTEHGCYNLFPGACFVLRMWEHSVARHTPGTQRLLVPWVCFHSLSPRGRNLLPHGLALPPLYRQVSDVAFLDLLMTRMVQERESGNQRAALDWLRAALRELDRHDRAAYSGVPLEQAGLIDGLCTQIRENPAACRNTAALARRAHYSTDHFTRLFKRYKGITPGEFIIRARIQMARNLLKFSSHTATQIALSLGYPDLYSFSKQFRSRTGLSPSEYRSGR